MVAQRDTIIYKWNIFKAILKIIVLNWNNTMPEGDKRKIISIEIEAIWRSWNIPRRNQN